MTLWGDRMQVLTDLTLDKLINLYVGIVTHDKKQLIELNGMTTGEPRSMS